MENIIKRYRNFMTNGLNDELSEYQKLEILNLEATIEKLKVEKRNLLNHSWKIQGRTRSGSFLRDALIIDYYDSISKAKIFDLKKRKGSTITFVNDQGTLCEIINIIKDKGKYVLSNNWPILEIRCSSRRWQTKMTLNRFLDLVCKKDFSNIQPKEFAEAYLRPYYESNTHINSLNAVDTRLNQVYNQLSFLYIKYNLYDSKYLKLKNELEKEFNMSLTKYEKLKKEAYREEDINKIKKETQTNLQKINTIWNSTLLNKDKAVLLGWICKNIYSMRLYVLKGGASEKCMDEETAYPDDIYGKKRRTIPEYTEDGKLISCDSVGGYISFKNEECIKSCPKEILQKLCQNKDINNLFKGKRLNDLNLMLFLLNEYNKYGFKVGQRHLSTVLNIADLVEEKFKDYAENFNFGYTL
jgi:hypothetical protein